MGAEGGEDRPGDEPPTTNEVEDRGVMSEAGVEPAAAAVVRNPTTGHADGDDGDDNDSAAIRPTPNVDGSINDDAPRAAHGADAAMAMTPSPSAEDAAAAISPSLSPLSPGIGKRFTVAEVPRWRFVNVAKKTSGYSSVAAGTVVEGLSAEELAAKYEAPEIEEEPAKQKGEKKIGKLNLREAQKEAEETITGTFAGFKKSSKDVRADGPTKDELETPEGGTLEPPLVHPQGLSPLMADLPSRMEENAAQLTEDEPTKLEISMTEASSNGSEMDRSEKQVDPAVPVEPAEPTARASEDEETAETKMPEEEEEPPRSKRRKRLLLLLLLLLVVLATVIGVLLGGKDSENDSVGSKAVGGATIIGEENNVNKTSSFVPTFYPKFSPTSTPALLELTSVPPTEYLPDCPANTKLLTVGQGGNNNNNNDMQDEQLRENSMSTWLVKDACTNQEVMRCQPCPNYTPSALFDNVRSSTTMGINEKYAASGSSDDVSGCLPDDKDYVFEVERSNGAGACCGFDPDSFVVTYNGIEVTRGEPYAPNIFGNGKRSSADPSNGGKSYFGQRVELCPSSDPSTSPSVEPNATYLPTMNVLVPSASLITDVPTEGPSNRPTASPSKRPTPSPTRAPSDPPSTSPSEQPTAKPTQRPSNPPTTARPSNGPTKGPTNSPSARPTTAPSASPVTDVPTEGPSDRPTTSPSKRPTPSPTPAPSGPPSTSPSEQPTAKPTQRPSNPPTTARPSNRPTKTPTDRPSSRPTTAPPSKKPTKIPTRRPLSPTEKPSCDAEYEDFNLCFAIDMSGSVCNQKTGFECHDCEPSIICNEMGIDTSMCCSNFLEVVDFAKLMVETLESVPANQAYTVVGFANDATLASGIMIRPDEAMEALEELTYSGGLTNHAAAFDKCRESGSLFRRKDLILLITDGDPSEPRGSAQAEAVKAADEAKAEGISIIPVMIVPEVATELNPQTVAYLKEISSDGSIFEVSDFSVLENLQGSLLAQVSCQV